MLSLSVWFRWLVRTKDLVAWSKALQSLLVSKETWARFLPKVIAIVSVCEGEPSYVVSVFSSTFFNWKYFRAEISPQTTCR